MVKGDKTVKTGAQAKALEKANVIQERANITQEKLVKEEMKRTQETRQWHICTIAAIIIGPLLAVLFSHLLWLKSPDLTYSFTNSEHSQELRLVKVKIMNLGSATSENVNGWVDFPSGETATYIDGALKFEVQDGKNWKKLETGTILKIKTNINRVYFRCSRIQPDIQSSILFYSTNKKGIDFTKNAEVHLGDDTGVGKRIILRE